MIKVFIISESYHASRLCVPPDHWADHFVPARESSLSRTPGAQKIRGLRVNCAEQLMKRRAIQRHNG
jgi:hypothetical protein